MKTRTFITDVMHCLSFPSALIGNPDRNNSLDSCFRRNDTFCIRISFIIAILFTLMCLSERLWALSLGLAKEDGGKAGAFLNYGAGARSMGMGRTFIGVADDASAAYWNPAGLVQLEQQELTALYASLYEETAYSFVSYARPMAGNGTIGISGVNLNSGGFKLRDEYNYDQGIASLNESAAIVSYGRKLLNNKNVLLSGGVSIKAVNQNINSISDTGYGMDVGLFCMPAGERRLSLGISLQNVVAPSLKLKENADKYPFTSTLGLGYRLLDNRLLFALDLNKAENQEVKAHLGSEYRFKDVLALRAGLNDIELTCGLGIRWHTYTLDYAFAFHNAWNGNEDANLGISHRFSLTVKFGKSR